MKKIFKNAIVLCVVFILCLGVLPLTASAADTTISFSKSNVLVGDSVTVTVRVSQKNLSGTQVYVNYNEEVLTYVSGADGGAGSLTIVDDKLTGSESSAKYTINFKAKKAGSCVISVSGVAAAGIPPEDIKLSGASATMNVKDATLSSNANIKALSVSEGSLSPVFSKSKTSYTVNVKKSVESCKIYVTTEDSDAKVSIYPQSTALEIGANKREITVTAPSGNTKKYTVTINRSNVDDENESNTSSTLEEINEALETVIGGVSYVVMKDITGVSLPDGFDVAVRLYNSEDVSVAQNKDGTIQIFYLKASGSDAPIPYIYNENDNSFSRIMIMEQSGKKYIVFSIPQDITVNDDYYLTNVTIDDNNVECYGSRDETFDGMYYLYCYYDGDYGFYRYDSIENVLQRSPEFIYKQTGAVSANDSADSFINRFNGLSINAKIIVVCLSVIAIGFVALIVLLVIKFVRRGKYEDYDEEFEEDDFDSIEFDDNFQLISSEEDDK